MKAREQGVIGEIPEWECVLTDMVTLATSGELTRTMAKPGLVKSRSGSRNVVGPHASPAVLWACSKGDIRWYILSQ